MRLLRQMLSTYQTHKLIKQSLPTVETQYERDNPQGQLTFEEMLDKDPNTLVVGEDGVVREITRVTEYTK